MKMPKGWGERAGETEPVQVVSVGAEPCVHDKEFIAPACIQCVAVAIQVTSDASADTERKRVFDMIQQDIKTITGLDWAPWEGRTLTWIFAQHKAAGVASERAAYAKAEHDLHKGDK